MDIDRIYNIDCLEGMKQIPDKSIDAIICDLPYGSTHNRWDSVIPFEPLWKEYKRIIKDHGAIVLFGQGLFTAELICSNKSMYRYSLVWEKTKAGGFLNANRMPLQSHEDLAVFYKHLPVYHPQMQKGKPYRKLAVTNGDGGNYGKFERIGHVLDNKGTRFPKSVIKVANDNHKSLHRTQKPVALIRYLIRTYTDMGGVVLDNCMGSGTTAIAAMQEGRHWLGFELDPDFYDIAVKRIENENKLPVNCW